MFRVKIKQEVGTQVRLERRLEATQGNWLRNLDVVLRTTAGSK